MNHRASKSCLEKDVYSALFIFIYVVQLVNLEYAFYSMQSFLFLSIYFLALSKSSSIFLNSLSIFIVYVDYNFRDILRHFAAFAGLPRKLRAEKLRCDKSILYILATLI